METAYLKELASTPSVTSFSNRRIEEEYQAYVAHSGEATLRRQLLIGVAMIFGVTILDFRLTSGAFTVQALWIRGAVILPVIATLYALTYVRRAYWLRQVAAVVTALTVAIASLLIAYVGRRAAQPAIAGGYFVIVLFVFFFLGLRYWLAVATSVMLIGLYLLSAIWSGAIGSAVLLYSSHNLAFFGLICALGAGQLEIARRRDFLTRRLLNLRAETDALTELANRRAFDTGFLAAWREAAARRHSLALMLLDVDFFKDYNDYYGHQAGDRVLRRVADVLRRVLRRPGDFSARYGGEEFVVVVDDLNKAQLLELAHQIRREVMHETIDHQSSPFGVLTVSLGVALVKPRTTEHSPQGFLQMADEALYVAKEQGRNQVVDADATISTTTGDFKVTRRLEEARRTMEASGS